MAAADVIGAQLTETLLVLGAAIADDVALAVRLDLRGYSSE
jgi:hypothetical protein